MVEGVGSAWLSWSGPLHRLAAGAATASQGRKPAGSGVGRRWKQREPEASKSMGGGYGCAGGTGWPTKSRSAWRKARMKRFAMFQ